MIQEFFQKLADMYIEYQPEAPDRTFIEADIRDLYKNGNLGDAFPYLDELNAKAYEEETTLIYELSSFIADTLTN